MKRRIIYSVLIVVISSMVLLIGVLNYHTNNAKIRITEDDFRFCFTTSFKGNRWKLYINSSKKMLCSFVPLDGMSQREMKQKLGEDIVTLYNSKKVRVYCILDCAYHVEGYPIVYTLDGKEFYLWNEDDTCMEKDAKKRLEKLYEHIEQEELKEYIRSEK